MYRSGSQKCSQIVDILGQEVSILLELHLAGFVQCDGEVFRT